MRYEGITNEMFDEELERIVGEESAGGILAIPGVYECLSEYFNNDVLEALAPDEDED